MKTKNKPTKLGALRRTSRGFELIEFKDEYDCSCSLQQSSLAINQQPGSSAIWLGTDDVNPQILSGAGWIPYQIPRDVMLSSRMHLNRKQVASLIGHLEAWLDNGSFEVK